MIATHKTTTPHHLRTNLETTEKNNATYKKIISASATAATTHADNHPGHNLYSSLGCSIFDQGDSKSTTPGKRFNQWRVELPYSRSSPEIDEHKGASAAGIAREAIDTGALTTGNFVDLGVITVDLAANAGGGIDMETRRINTYYDFNLG